MNETRLRSQDWYGGLDRDGFLHRSWMRRGLPDEALDGSKPIIGICTSWSQLTPCNQHLDLVAEHVSRGVWEAGGVPLIFPAMSIGENNFRPTAMLVRNLMAMVVEESIRGNPLDGVVALSGCDKTTAAMWLGTASVDLPTLVLTGGPMITGTYRGKPLGSGTDVWRFSEDVRAGRMTTDEFIAAESCMTRSAGHCNTMGTASTLACLTEAIGLALPGTAAIPAPDSRRNRAGHLAGRRAVEMVHQDQRLSSVVTAASLRNAVRVNAAIGGSTNAVVHLLALSGRLGLGLTLDDFDSLGSELPLLVDLAPSGRFQMDDFFAAGGLPAVLAELAPVLELDAMTVTGRTLGEEIASAEVFDREVIRTLDQPVMPAAGIAVLRGNLAPRGAVIKPSAASPELFVHTGRAVVFESIEDFHARIDDPTLDVEADDILVLKGCGPKGYPGMPEVGNMPLPPKLLAAGVTDMVRISDARMSGTAYGTVVLHVAPESSAGGPLAVVRSGDRITLDVPGRRLTLEIDDDELEARMAELEPIPPAYDRGWYRLYIDTVNQADEGADLTFLRGKSTDRVARESH